MKYFKTVFIIVSLSIELVHHQLPNTSLYDANDDSRILDDRLKTCLNPPRGRGGKRIGTLASEDGTVMLKYVLIA